MRKATFILIALFTLYPATSTLAYLPPVLPTEASPQAIKELATQLSNPKIPPIAYWDQVAICESSKDGHTADWHDRGRWSGGLGIYIGTWVRWGGRNFAPTPWQATKLEQIVVANRIAVTGYHFFTYSKNPVGFMGWGCIAKRQSLKPTPKVWNKYRTVSQSVSGNVSGSGLLPNAGNGKAPVEPTATGSSLR